MDFEDTHENNKTHEDIKNISMDFETARKILSLPQEFDERELKKMYFKKSLLCHPDKNKNNTHEEFININKAYEYLKQNKKCPTTDFDKIINSIFSVLSKNCTTFSIKIFETLKKPQAIEIYDWLYKYQHILSIPTDVLENMEFIIREKIKNDNIILLNPSIDDITNHNIYVLSFNNKTYYVPLWHTQLVFENTLTIKCIPDLSENIQIDEDNNIHYFTKESILDLLKRGKIEYKIGSIEINIDSKELMIKKFQIIQLKNIGISKTNEDIYDISLKSNIYVHMELY